MQPQIPSTQLEFWLTKFLFLFAPLVYPDNPLKTRRANFLGIIIPATFIASLFIVLGEALGEQIHPTHITINLMLGLSCVVLGNRVHRGDIAQGSFIFLLLVYIYITAALIIFGTLQNPAILGYSVFIIGAGILFNRKGMIVATALSFGTTLGLLLAYENGLIKWESAPGTLTHWSIYTALLVVIGGIVFWGVQVVWQAFTRVDHQVAELESSPVSILITDSEGKIEYVNPKYTQMTGFTRNEVIATHPSFLRSEEMLQETPSKLWATLLAGQVWQSEFQDQRKNGESFFASYSITPITNATGQIFQFVIAIRDISELKRIEAERVALNRTREFATLYEITHDLGTFTSISTLFEIILTRLSDLLNVSGGAVYLLDTDQGRFQLVSKAGVPLHWELPISYAEWMLAKSPCIESNLPLVVRVPIWYADEILGMLVLSIRSFDNARSDKPNLNLLALLATQIASAIHNLRLFDQVRASRVRAHVLAKEILSAQESERRLISRELHDEFGQELTSVQFGLQDIVNQVNQPDVQDRLNNLMGTVEQVLEQMRDLSRGLRPSVLDDFGLVPALEWLVDQQIKSVGLESELIADELDCRLPEEVETVCFRVAQEAITNVVRHGHATRVVVEFHLISEKLKLTIQDNGVGFDLVAAMKNVTMGHSLGLLNMHERVELIGGHLQIITLPAQGTHIEVQIPLKPNPQPVERRTLARSLN